MRKRSIKRLSLTRETLRDMNGQDLTRAAGGTLTYGGYCTAYCSFSCAGNCEYETHSGGTDCCE